MSDELIIDFTNKTNIDKFDNNGIVVYNHDKIDERYVNFICISHKGIIGEIDEKID